MLLNALILQVGGNCCSHHWKLLVLSCPAYTLYLTGRSQSLVETY